MLKILDGGMGAELVARGVTQRGGLWSAAALLDAPEAVYQLHVDYLRAGADILTTNTYSTVPSYLAKAGISDQFDELAALAASLARRAAERAGAKVAGSLPPLQESYRPDLVLSAEVARPIYRALAMALEPDVDLFLCETMSSVQEARNAAIEAIDVAARGGRQPVYVSFTLADAPGSGLRSGESLDAAVAGLADLPIAGVLVNCSPPESLEQGLATLRAASDGHVGCYANRMVEVPEGWTLDNDLMIQYRDDLSSALLAQWARRCVERGAEIVGGCCGVGPRDIEVIATTLKTETPGAARIPKADRAR